MVKAVIYLGWNPIRTLEEKEKYILFWIIICVSLKINLSAAKTTRYDVFGSKSSTAWMFSLVRFFFYAVW